MIRRFLRWLDEASGRAQRRRDREEMIQKSAECLAQMMRAEATKEALKNVHRQILVDSIFRDSERRTPKHRTH